MEIRVLGCDGGMGPGLYTSSFLINNAVLVDAGSGIQNLTFEEMLGIDHIFITHTHADHSCFLPLLLDTVAEQREKPVKIYGVQETISALKAHLFNNVMWPDFSLIPSKLNPFLTYQQISVKQTLHLEGIELEVVAMKHSIPTVGFLVTSETNRQFMLSSDTAENPELWAYLNGQDNLIGVAIDVSYDNANEKIAIESQHLSPNRLLSQLELLNQSIPVYVMHMKPSYSETIMQELQSVEARQELFRLKNSQVIQF